MKQAVAATTNGPTLLLLGMSRDNGIFFFMTISILYSMRNHFKFFKVVNSFYGPFNNVCVAEIVYAIISVTEDKTKVGEALVMI